MKGEGERGTLHRGGGLHFLRGDGDEVGMSWEGEVEMTADTAWGGTLGSRVFLLEEFCSSQAEK